jgi:hypothetical protein
MTMSEASQSSAPPEPRDLAVSSGDELVFHLPKCIDSTALASIRLLLNRAAPSDRVILDFAAVRECQTFVLVSMMAWAMEAGSPRVHTRGLNAHQLKVLQYCASNAPPSTPLHLHPHVAEACVADGR